MSGRRRLPLLVAALVGTGCGAPPGESTLVRLVDLLPSAQIESPLVGLPAASFVSDLEGVAATEVWRDDFEGAEPGLHLTGQCSRQQDEEAGSILACEKDGRAEIDLAIEPGTSYRVRLRARSSRDLGHSVTVSEGSLDELLRIFPFPDFTERWQPFETWLHTTAQSRRLVIAIEPRHSQARLWLDELVVERLELSAEQELSLLKARRNRAAPARVHGFVKRGRLLPVDDPEWVDSPRAANYTVRDAIFAPAPTDLHFQISAPRDARLALAYGFAEQAAPGDGARFRVLVSEAGREPRVLLDEALVLGASAEAWRWHAWQGSLADFADRPVRLTLETRALDTRAPDARAPDARAPTGGGRRAYALWGSPEIYTPRRDGEPNLILIAVDTLRADRISCYGYRPGTTPAIDALADEGVRFDQAIASANWTRPSFQALFTGHGVLGLDGDLRRSRQTTLSERLSAAGYATAAIAYKPALYDVGFDRGFDTFLNAPRYHIQAEANVTQALEWLRRNRDRRFFLFLHFDDPHQPFCQPSDHLDDDLQRRLGTFALRLPFMVGDRNATNIDPRHPMRATPRRRPCRHCRNEPGELVPELRDVVRAIYDDNVRYVDQQMGRFLEALQDEDLYDESVIAFVSDHGEALWDHDGQLAHGRTNLYDELVHVPLIVKPAAGARWARGRVVEAQVRLFDLAPTLLELAGIEVPSEAEGARSLAPALRADGPSLRDRPAFSAAENDKALSLRHDGFKYIRHFPDGLAPGAAGAEALYDLREDPAEHRDVAADRPQVLARMRLAVDELLTTAEKEHGPTGGADLDPVDARQLEALRALGYIE